MLFFTCALIFLSSFSLTFGDLDFKVRHCDNGAGARNAVQLLGFQLKNDKIYVPGDVEAAVKFNVSKPLLKDRKYVAKLTLERDTFLGWIKIPCIAGLGSCDFDLCDLLDKGAKQLAVGDTCKQIPCSCDNLKTGLYDAKNFKIKVTKAFLNKVPLPSFLLYSDYKAEIKVVRKDNNEEMACLHVEFTLSNPDCTGLFCG